MLVFRPFNRQRVPSFIHHSAHHLQSTGCEHPKVDNWKLVFRFKWTKINHMYFCYLVDIIIPFATDATSNYVGTIILFFFYRHCIASTPIPLYTNALTRTHTHAWSHFDSSLFYRIARNQKQTHTHTVECHPNLDIHSVLRINRQIR